MNGLVEYPGAKYRIADWICSHFPEHKVYLEPYLGSGAVFFRKEPTRIETLNDLDGEVTNFFRVIREQSEELICLLEMTPWSREEYEAVFLDTGQDSEVERARKFAIRCMMGMGTSIRYQNGFRFTRAASGPWVTKRWRELPETLSQAAMRLKNAQIENRPAKELICKYNTSDTLLYIDPPYLQKTRKRCLYKQEMDEQDHAELLELLVNHQGKIVISGYENALYNEKLRGWRKAQKRTQTLQGATRTETIWMNYDGLEQMELKF